MEAAYDVAFTSLKDPKPRLVQIPYSTWSDVLVQVGRENPTILHFGWHAETSGMILYEKTVQPEEMITAIKIHNDFACKSENF